MKCANCQRAEDLARALRAVRRELLAAAVLGLVLPLGVRGETVTVEWILSFVTV